MKAFDYDIAPPVMSNPNDTAVMAAYAAKVQEVLQTIIDNLKMSVVQESAPVANTMHEQGLSNGDKVSEIVITHNSTQNQRTLSYLYEGTVYKIQSA